MNAGLHLIRRLLEVGQVAGRRGESGRVRFVALIMATLVLSIAVASLVAVNAGYTGVSERVQARIPVEAEAATDTKASLLMVSRTDNLADGRTFEVLVVDPADGAPTPPGIDEWPGPGEVLLSPALLEEGASEEIEDRYGTLRGTIRPEGLADPVERLAYVGARRHLDPDAGLVTRVMDFGISSDGWYVSGYHSGDRPEWSFQVLVVGLVVLPGLALMLVAARTGSHARDRRVALVTGLGGRGRDRFWISIGEAWRPVVIGAAIAFGVVSVTMLANLPVPVTGYVLSATDMRGAAPELALAITGVVTLVLGAVSWANRHRRPRLSRKRDVSTRPAGSMRPLTLAWGALCPVMIFSTVFLPDMLFTPGSGYSRYLGWAGSMGTALTLPALVAAGTVLFGRLLARLGRVRRKPGHLVAGRRLATHSGPTGRMVAGVAIGIFLFLQAVGWQSIFANDALNLEQRQEQIGRSAVSIENEAAELGKRSDVGMFLERLPSHAAPLAMTVSETDDGTSSVTVHGQCGALQSVGLGCEDGATVESAESDEVAPWLSDVLAEHIIGFGYVEDDVEEDEPNSALTVDVTGDVTDIVVSKAEEFSPTLMIFDTRGRDIDIPAVKSSAFRYLPSGAEVNLSLGDGGYEAALRDQSLWALLLGVVAVSIMTIAAALSGAAEFVRHGKALAPLSVLTGSIKVFRTGAMWVVSLPLSGAIVLSLAVGTWLAKPIDRAGFITPGLIATVAAITLVLSAVMSIWAGQIAVWQAQRWRPSGSD